MSNFVFRSAGTKASGTVALTPGAPAGKQVGDTLIMPTVTRDNGQTLVTPTGWTPLEPGLHGPWNHLFGRIADGTALDTPTIDYSGTPHAVAQIAAFSGGGITDLTAIVANSIDKNGTNLNVPYDAMSVIVNNTLNIALSTHNKTTASDAATFAALSPFTKIDELYGAGTDIAFWWGYNIQTSASSYSAGTHTYTGSADTLQYTSLIVSLLSAAVGSPRRTGRAPIGLPFVRIY